MATELQPGVVVCPDAAGVAAAAAELFCRVGEQALAARGSFTVALSGGSTPKAAFALLCAAPFRTRLDWSRLQLFWSDERAVPPDDPASNYGMAATALLDRVPIPPAHCHRLRGELRPLATAAAAYEDEIRKVVPAGPDGVPAFDLIMLGMGEEGHTASLFPHSPALAERELLVAPNYVAALDAQRLTFTPRLLNAARTVSFLIAGGAKAEALAAVLEGPREPLLFPAQLVAPLRGTLYWLVDRAAASGLRRRAKG